MFIVCMQDYYYSRSHVPAFGSWDWNNDLPFTQCFESARQAGLLRYSYSEDRDLYVTGDLYENDVVTPAMIVVPRRRVSYTVFFALHFTNDVLDLATQKKEKRSLLILPHKFLAKQCFVWDDDKENLSIKFTYNTHN